MLYKKYVDLSIVIFLVLRPVTNCYQVFVTSKYESRLRMQIK